MHSFPGNKMHDNICFTWVFLISFGVWYISILRFENDLIWINSQTTVIDISQIVYVHNTINKPINKFSIKQ